MLRKANCIPIHHPYTPRTPPQVLVTSMKLYGRLVGFNRPPLLQPAVQPAVQLVQPAAVGSAATVAAVTPAEAAKREPPDWLAKAAPWAKLWAAPWAKPTTPAPPVAASTVSGAVAATEAARRGMAGEQPTPAAPSAPRERRALVVGVDYTRAGVGLSGCANRARAMAERLREVGYECVTLLDEGVIPSTAPAAVSATPTPAPSAPAPAGDAAAAAAADPALPEARRILKELMALVQWARGGRARQVWIHYCGVGMNQAVVLGGEAAADESGVAMVPLDVAERGVITNEVFGLGLKLGPKLRL